MSTRKSPIKVTIEISQSYNDSNLQFLKLSDIVPCKFCHGYGVSEYEDFLACFASKCNKNLKPGEHCENHNKCKIVHGKDICPDCLNIMKN